MDEPGVGVGAGVDFAHGRVRLQVYATGEVLAHDVRGELPGVEGRCWPGPDGLGVFDA